MSYPELEIVSNSSYCIKKRLGESSGNRTHSSSNSQCPKNKLKKDKIKVMEIKKDNPFMPTAAQMFT